MQREGASRRWPGPLAGLLVLAATMALAWPAQAQVLQGRVEENVGHDPYLEDRKNLRRLEEAIEDHLEESFRAQPEAARKQAEAALREYVQANEAYLDAWDQVLTAPPGKEEEARRKATKLEKAAAAAREAWREALSRAQGAVGDARKVQDVSKARAARQAAMRRSEEMLRRGEDAKQSAGRSDAPGPPAENRTGQPGPATGGAAPPPGPAAPADPRDQPPPPRDLRAQDPVSDFVRQVLDEAEKAARRRQGPGGGRGPARSAPEQIRQRADELARDLERYQQQQQGATHTPEQREQLERAAGRLAQKAHDLLRDLPPQPAEPQLRHIYHAQDLVKLIFGLYGGNRPIGIVKLAPPDATRPIAAPQSQVDPRMAEQRYLLLLSGTEVFNLPQATHLPEDITAALHRFDLFRLAVLEALADYPVPNGATLYLAGHSLGGMEAQNLLQEEQFVLRGYRVLALTTFGSPITAAPAQGVYYRRFASISDLVPFLSPRSILGLDRGEQTIVRDRGLLPQYPDLGLGRGMVLGIAEHMRYPEMSDLWHFDAIGQERMPERPGVVHRYLSTDVKLFPAPRHLWLHTAGSVQSTP